MHRRQDAKGRTHCKKKISLSSLRECIQIWQILGTFFNIVTFTNRRKIQDILLKEVPHINFFPVRRICVQSRDQIRSAKIPFGIKILHQHFPLHSHYRITEFVVSKIKRQSLLNTFCLIFPYHETRL